MRVAYLLVSHGSSDPRHQTGLTRLAQGVRQHLGRLARSEMSTSATDSADPLLPPSVDAIAPSSPLPFKLRSLAAETDDSLPLVGTATLEAATAPLAEQVINFVHQAVRQDIHQVVVMPLFLLAGIHVKEDLPAEIAAARAQLPATVTLSCFTHLGGHQQFQRYVAARLTKTKADRCVLLAHGSRRTSGNRAIQQLGNLLDTDVAFWSVAPDLETQIHTLMQQGHQHIAIAPFFLFPGGITDAIIRRTEQIAEHLPKLSLRLLSPLEIGRAHV